MPRRVRYDHLPTERLNPRSRHLDQLPLPRLLRLMHEEDLAAVRAMRPALPHIARAIQAITHSLRGGGRLFFVGAGTSGRLGVIEAAECPPTFHTPPSLVQALMAGGRPAVFRSREGAEDRAVEVRRLIRRRVRRGDAVVGIAASGVTPFVDAALRAAAHHGARTILLTCNPKTSIPAQVRIAVAVGPEVLSGSTRLKAGTATKLALNMLTLGAMVALGKTYGHLMVDVRPTSRKLRARAVTMLRLLTRCSGATATTTLRASGGQVKVAALMIQQRLSAAHARRRLSLAGGSLRRALHAA
ncbi:MAG: N-acetylmuramic acid 6-phosphate etherase [Candidatus Omnitrophica bacterium CG11_big_fil_rev_8_21_14_0_20_63_9]|nr:MAG: N-acetylmuramic acid 6-phosphate etherase [Candidatus Omnitrophica bacterium CG11_big_fil_rev_8_21_14_0_20_63_9]